MGDTKFSNSGFYGQGVTIRWKAVEQHFTVMLFVIQVDSGCNFGLGTVKSEMINPIERYFTTGIADVVRVLNKRRLGNHHVRWLRRRRR